MALFTICSRRSTRIPERVLLVTRPVIPESLHNLPWICSKGTLASIARLSEPILALTLIVAVPQPHRESNPPIRRSPVADPGYEA